MKVGDLLDPLNVRLHFEPASSGAIELDELGRLQFPAVPNTPASYCFLISSFDNIETSYVGETDHLRRRLYGYRNPGPSQFTNQRLNERMVQVLSDGGEITLTVVDTALVEGYGIDQKLDFRDKTARVLVESAWLLLFKSKGITVENA